MSKNAASCQSTNIARIRNKAVAEGAILSTLDHFVSSRVAKYTYGIEMCCVFDPNLADHLARADTCIEVGSGEICVQHRFSSILQKVDLTLLYIVSLLIFDRIPRFQRRESSGHLIAACIPSLNSLC